MFSTAVIAVLSLAVAGLGYWCKKLTAKASRLELENEITKKEAVIMENENNHFVALDTDDGTADELRRKASLARKLEPKGNK